MTYKPRSKKWKEKEAEHPISFPSIATDAHCSGDSLQQYGCRHPLYPSLTSAPVIQMASLSLFDQKLETLFIRHPEVDKPWGYQEGESDPSQLHPFEYGSAVWLFRRVLCHLAYRQRTRQHWSTSRAYRVFSATSGMDGVRGSSLTYRGL